MGATLNKRPDLFTAALMEVPFVDCLNTMLDATIPWTTFEYEEWGNPADPTIYNLMKGYDPYGNIEPKRYPHMLVCAGLNDPRVSYAEPAKYTARLRYNKNLYSEKRAAEQKRILFGAVDGLIPLEDSLFERQRPEEDTMLLFRVEDVGHSGSAGQYAALEVNYPSLSSDSKWALSWSLSMILVTFFSSYLATPFFVKFPL